MASPKKHRSKPPRNRPEATSGISQPVVQDASSLTALSSFSPNGSLFAFLSLAVDKHRLRVYDTVSGRSVAEQVVDSARVTALAWNRFDPSAKEHSAADDLTSQPSKKKKRRKSHVAAVTDDAPGPSTEVVVLGLADGTLLFFSPTHGRIIRTLSHSSSTAAILSLAVPDSRSTIWTSSADGTIRLWNAAKNDVVASWKNDDRIPYSFMAIRPKSPRDEDDRVHMLVANHGIHLLATQSEATSFETQKPKKLASFTGHASAIKDLQWDASQKPFTRFLSLAEGDRFVYIWEVPSGSSNEGKIIASIPLDSNAQHISLSITPTTSTSGAKKQSLITLSASGKISVFPIPAELTPPAGSDKSRQKVPTLLSRSNISISTKKNASPVHIVNASFASEDGRICVVRLVGGVRPVFDVVQYLDDSGEFIQDVKVVKDDSAELITEASVSGAAPNKRYAESSSLAVHSGIEIGQDESMDDLALHGIDGALDVDLAELSLGQRLTALAGSQGAVGQASASDSDDAAPNPLSEHRKRQETSSVVPANSLSRTLIQALHSSDARLLETCLAHSKVELIRNTVSRLPPQLAVPLLLACVERLGRGARGGTMRGGGGGASSQRGSGLIAWVKAVLAIHSGHLMTMPDLVARLAGLHATLTSRLTLQESLLSLSGRLDLVLSQIEMRSSAAPAPLPLPKDKQKAGKRQAKRYIEGESEEDEEMGVEVEMGSGDDAGSVEDVELGGESQDEDEGQDDEDSVDDENSVGEDEEDDEEDYSDGEGPTLNGFIDDEAEESDEGDGEDDDESE